jgi:3-deoxy-manno-octulosonate cytidylyltransferase (CMP-KDO synthetase)|tara:strand:+ start:152 stop:874 length:723 start_codon:yes stop_codon:yes gene_type:complete
MKSTIIVIPSRLGAERLKGKPLMPIKGIPMIIHVLKSAIKSGVGEVYVTSPDNEILEVVNKHGGNGILTGDHPNGTTRVWETFKKIKNENVDLIVNMQGDQVMLSPRSISKLEKLMRKHNSPIGTLASKLNKDEISDQNVVKVEVETDLKEESFLKAKDFFRIKKVPPSAKIYHHVGMYCFQPSYLKQYVELGETKQEKIQKLEQLRILGKIDIKVGYCDSNALSVDTFQDLQRAESEMR